MPFRNIVNPDELALLRQILDEHCAENGVGTDDPEREHIAFRIMTLVNSGIAAGPELKRHLQERDARGTNQA